jgi:hypothetical protein
VVIPDLSVLGQEEGAAVVAAVGDRRPATLAEEGTSTSTAVVPDASAAVGPDALAEGRAEPWPVLGSSGLIPAQLDLSEWGGGRSCSGAAAPRTRNPSSPSTMSWKRDPGIISVSISRRR